MPPAGFEPTISAGERPQTYALDRAATGTGIIIIINGSNSSSSSSILVITFMQGIGYLNYIPETNHACRVYIVLLLLLLM